VSVQIKLPSVMRGSEDSAH